MNDDECPCADCRHGWARHRRMPRTIVRLRVLRDCGEWREIATSVASSLFLAERLGKERVQVVEVIGR